MQSIINIHYSVKLYRIVIFKYFGIIFLIFSTLSTFGSNDTGTVSKVIKQFGAGVNISHFEQYWKTPEAIYKEDITEKIKAIADKGFRTVRLPIAFDMYLQSDGYNFQSSMIQKLKEILTLTYSLQMKLVITYHYGKLTDNNCETGEIDRIIAMWKQLQYIFKGNAYDELFFDLYNEPTLSEDKWKPAITRMVTEMRKEDSQRIYIVGGTDYNSENELMALGKIGDNKLIYTFHYYEPFIFTHQGAEWTGNRTKLTGLPFPYKRRKMPKMLAEAKGTDTEKDYLKYNIEADDQYIRDRMRQIASFCVVHQMPLLCTEAGVIKEVDNTYRKRYLKALTYAFEEFYIHAVLWEYDQRFAIEGDKISVFSALKKWIRRSKKY